MTRKHKAAPRRRTPPAETHRIDAIRARVSEHPGWIAAGAAAAALAGAALFNHGRARAAEAETPPIGKFVEAGGARLHYVDRGEGPAVVLLHGNGMALQDWQASGVFDRLAERHRVIAFDRPGFGYSSRPRSTVWTPAAQGHAIAEALRTLGVERPVLVGHSWGTLVALAMAIAHPDEIAGLVLVSGYYHPTARPDVAIFSPPAVPGVGDVMAHTVSPLAGRLMAPAMLKAMFAPAPVPESFGAFPLELSLRPSQIRAVAADTALMVPAAAAIGPQLGQIAIPVAILGGEGDLITHFDEHAAFLARTIPNRDLHRVPGQGHMLHYAVPDLVVDAVETIARRAA